jgi:spore germination protein GerM
VRLRALALCVVVGLGAGCAVSPRDDATPVDGDRVPYGLLDPDAAAVLPQQSGRRVELCLLRDHLLVPVVRAVDQPAALIDIVRALVDVTDAESASGLGTSLVASDEIVSVQRSAGVATVGLAEEASERLTADPLATVAQIVCTLTRQPGVGLVRFTVGELPVEVPRADGTLSSGPVSGDDYSSLLESPG